MLPPIAVLLIAGFWRALSSKQPAHWLVIFGFMSAAAPAAMLPELFTIDRELSKVPFAILLATLGARWLWSVPVMRDWSGVARACAAMIATVAIGYALWSLATRGRLPTSTALALGAAVVIFLLGRELDRRRTLAPVVGALMVAVPLLFVAFVTDYFDGYRLRSSGWFGGNIRGALEEIVQREHAVATPEIYISTDIPYIRSYWSFYQHVFHRDDLAQKTKVFDRETFDLATVPRSSLVLAPGDDPLMTALTSQGELRKEVGVKDRDDRSDPEQFVVYRR